MKSFISTLAAILVGAAIIFGIKACNDENERLARMRAETKEIERANARMENEIARMDRETKALQGQNETPPPTAPVDIPAPALMITLTEPVSIQTESGTVTLPVGTKLEFVSQLNTEVHVHYLNGDFFIPISATDLKRKPSKTAN